jgi:GH43 family beta-xylosidase
MKKTTLPGMQAPIQNGAASKKNWFKKLRLTSAVAALAICQFASAQNPIVRDQYSADPSARVFGDRVYVYPSHDILAQPGKGRVGWFCMEDYHVFSSANLTDWTDHGMIVTQNKVPWVKPDSYAMWAPDCIFRNGKYYFYFPATPNDSTIRGFTIGVATANKPSGPFTPEPTSIKGVRGIDPNVFMDDDGQAYLYWSQGNIFGAKLKQNMLELDSEVKTLGDLPTKGLKEGPYMFKHNGKYYLTYPHVENVTERLEYAMSDNPLGPFKVTGVIMDETPGCWTNHHSIIEFKKQHYLFYHANNYSPKFDKARSIRADSLSFNADGTIVKVKPTLRGIGVTDARSKIQIDRYSLISDTNGVAVAFIDTSNKFQGWKTTLQQPNAWVQYNSVQFGSKAAKTVTAKAMAPSGGTLVIRTGSESGPVEAEVKIPKSNDWQDVKATVAKSPTGTQNLVVQMKDAGNAELDWISFQ